MEHDENNAQVTKFYLFANHGHADRQGESHDFYCTMMYHRHRRRLREICEELVFGSARNQKHQGHAVPCTMQQVHPLYASIDLVATANATL